MSELAKRHFVRQQGFSDASAGICEYQYSALMFQPRLLLAVVLIAVLLQSAVLFLALSALLWWNVLKPSRNPFDALYNEAVAAPRSLPPLTPAPAPRRFSQAMAGTLLGAAGVALLAGRPRLSWLLQGFVVAALIALVFGRFCVGSYIYHLFRGRIRFANRTLPWSRPE